MLQVGIALALLCAVATNVGFLLKHRGACAAPSVSFRRPLRSAVGLLRSRAFRLGMLVALCAWCLHVGALALAPLSLVQAVLAGGLVLLTVLAERAFGCSVGTRQVVGVGLTALGLALLALTLPLSGDPHASYSSGGMVAFEAGLLGAGALLVLAPGQLASARHRGLLLGLAAGLLFGVSDVALKALTGGVAEAGPLALASPWTLTALVASIVAFLASARGLQLGAAVPVITVTSAGANVSAIAGGILVFGDPVGGDPLAVALQCAAFAMVLVAAALTPAPLRAAT